MTHAGKPNFFIVGAPKCGTTALYAFLKQHPSVFMPELKEPHYFATDLSYRGYVTNRHEYYRLFAAGAGHARIGEASVWYLYSQTAARNIQEELGHVRILVMLRNPVDMLHSLHRQAMRSGREDIGDFTQALEAEPDRRLGRRIPRTEYDRKLLFYSKIVDFAPQLQRYLDAFGSESVRVVLYDDFQRDLPATYQACLEFLDLDPSFAPPFSRVNANRELRSLRLQRTLRNPPAAIRRFARQYVLPPIRRLVYRLALRANTVQQPRRPLAAGQRAALMERFRPQVERLEKCLGRDLSLWFQPQPEAEAA